MKRNIIFTLMGMLLLGVLPLQATIYEVGDYSEFASAIKNHYNSTDVIRLTDDIDCSSVKTTLNITFQGTIDGQGHTLSGANIEGVGLIKAFGFYNTDSVVIKNLTIKNFNVAEPYGDNPVGILAATSKLTTFDNVHVINCTADGSKSYSNHIAGGFVGSSSGTTTFQNCSSQNDSIKATSGKIGGFVGYAEGPVSFYDCAYIGELSGATYSGGFIGYNENVNAAIYRCVSFGSVSAINSLNQDAFIKSSVQILGYGNNYCTSTSKYGTVKTAAEMSSGSVARIFYEAGYTQWGQRMNADGSAVDAAPVPYAPCVYKHGTIYNNVFALTFNVGKYFASMYLRDAAVIPAGLKAYTVSSVSGNEATMAKITGTIPACTGVVLERTDDSTAETYEFAATTDVAAIDNMMTGTLLATPSATIYAANENTTLYGLSSSGKSFWFNKVANESDPQYAIAANKGLLLVPATVAAAAKISVVPESVEGGVSVGVSSLPCGEGWGEARCGIGFDGKDIYNLAGQRINKLQKGINIINGKKILY